MKTTIDIKMHFCENCDVLLKRDAPHCTTCEPFAKDSGRYEESLAMLRELEAQRIKRQVREN
jgi:hypothetical protein